MTVMYKCWLSWLPLNYQRQNIAWNVFLKFLLQLILLIVGSDGAHLCFGRDGFVLCTFFKEKFQPLYMAGFIVSVSQAGQQVFAL